VVVGLDLDADGPVVVEAMTPELSLKTERVQSMPSSMSSCVAAATVDLRRLWMVTEPSGLTVCPGRSDQERSSEARFTPV
jgi:hypothetical protein